MNFRELIVERIKKVENIMKKIYVTPKMEVEVTNMETCVCIESLNSSAPTNLSGGPSNGGDAADDDEAAAKARGDFGGDFGSLW